MKVWMKTLNCLALVLLTACTAAAPGRSPITGTQNSPASGAEMPVLTSGTPSAPTETALPPASATPGAPDFTLVDFPDAESVTLAMGEDGLALIVFGMQEGLYVSKAAQDGVSFQAPVLATGAIPAFILPIERPALAAAVDRAGVAWLEMTETHSTRIWFARSLDGGRSFEPGQPVTTQAGEVTMVQLAMDATGSPALAWLRGESLQFARSFDGGASFEIVKRIGKKACDCCQPRIAVAGDQVYIAYRGLETDPKGDIRDAAFLHSSDGGRTFGPVIPVSDAHWYLPACPIAGPALAVQDGQILVAWMDSRGTPPGEPFQGRIWFAASSDGGESFSDNVQVSPEDGFHHTLPALAVGPQGRIHMAWEARLEEMDAILYAYSQDGGQTFSASIVFTYNREAERGSPRMPTLAASETGRVYLAWIDRLGARVAFWDDLP